MKHVVIIAPFVTFPGEPGANRFIAIARRLAWSHQVTLITSRFCHFTKSMRSAVPHLEGVTVILLDEPGYKRNVGIGRVISHARFCRNLTRWLASNPDFDLAYSAFPLIKTNLILAEHLRLKPAPLILDVQDIWPEAISGPLSMLSGGIGRALLWPLRQRALSAFRAADAMVAVSQTYLDHADQGRLPQNRKAVAFIGADRLNFDPDILPKPAAAPLRAVYLGTFAGSYDLATLIRASTLTTNATIELIGSGPYEDKLRALAAQLEAPVIFRGSMPFDQAMQALSKADVALNAIRASALQSVTNKLSDYFCSGLPILSSQQQPEVAALLAQGGGMSYQAGDAAGLAAFLDRLAASPEELRKMSLMNRSLAREKFLRETSYTAIDDLVERLLFEDKDQGGAASG